LEIAWFVKMINFTVEDSYFIKGRGLVYTGTINGVYSENELISASIKINNMAYKIIGTERFARYLHQPTQIGEKIGLWVKLNVPDADFHYIPNFVTDASLFYTLINNIDWQQEYVQMYGKKIPAPRLISLHGNKDYFYGGTLHKPKPFTDELSALLEKINTFAGQEFNSVLLNLYNSGKDYIGFHADLEKELGTNPTIASISLGAERLFHLKHKKTHELHKVILEDLSLLIMGNHSQELYLHSLPKDVTVKRERINITFRKIK
jgi:alkylated DNA repair dioxygenase AlkB